MNVLVCGECKKAIRYITTGSGIVCCDWDITRVVTSSGRVIAGYQEHRCQGY